MFKIEMMLNKKEGFRVVGYFYTLEETLTKIKLCKYFYKPLSIFYKQIM